MNLQQPTMTKWQGLVLYIQDGYTKIQKGGLDEEKDLTEVTSSFWAYYKGQTTIFTSKKPPKKQIKLLMITNIRATTNKVLIILQKD